MSDKKKTRVKIVTWNINDMADKTLGDKSTQNDFLSTIGDSTIFCLQETKKKTNIPDYLCYNSNRENSRSGGVCIGVHRSLEKHTKELETGDPDILAIKIAGKHVSLENDLVVINVYDSPENSSYKRKRIKEGKHIPTLENLLEFISSIQNCELFLAGDFNARSGGMNFMPENNELDEVISKQLDRGIYRSSKDSAIDSRGRQFLDFIGSCDLSILNGCTLGDIFGEFTCMKYNGHSVVDYMITSNKLKSEVLYLKVGELTKSLSDHRPVSCILNLQTSLTDAQELMKIHDDAPRRMKWTPAISPHLFHDELTNNQEISETINKLNSTQCKTKEDVINLNREIVNIYNKIGENIGACPNQPHGTRRYTRKNINSFSLHKMHPKNRWFDLECIVAKRNLNAAEKKYVKNPLDENIRLNYYRMKKEYRKMIKKKKNEFYADLSSNIMQNKTLSWECIKKLKSNNAAEKSTLDIFDMKRFYKFFKELYKNRPLAQSHPNHDSSVNDQKADVTNILNELITQSELSVNIQNLKNGKAGGIDNITNEFLKASSGTLLDLVTRLYNECLDKEVMKYTPGTLR